MITRWWNAAGAVWLLLAAVAHAAPVAPAAEAVKAFDVQYGGRIAAATASSEAADDIALAAELLAAATASETEPDLLPLLCRSAYDLAVKHVKGYRAAIKAMALLARKAPE